MVMLACLEHFSYHLNVWYLYSFDSTHIQSLWNQPSLVPLYEFHQKYLGHFLPVDKAFQWVGILFIPWLTHLYIALSGYNLARKTQAETRANLSRSLKIHGFLFCLFMGESLIVSSDFGTALSLFPITIWFAILALSSSIYAWFGVRGVFASLAIIAIHRFASLFHLIQPLSVDPILSAIHPWASHSTEPADYLLDCLFGFWVGWMHFIKKTSNKDKGIMASGSALATLIVGLFIADLFKINPDAVTANDELLSSQPLGVVFILFIEATVLLLVARLEHWSVPSFFKLFTWVGVNSIGVFFIHRIIFLKIFAPIRLHIGSCFDLPMTNTSAELLFVYLPLTLLCYWWLKRTGFFGPLFSRE